MADQTIRADQIEGLADMIREQVQAVLQGDARVDLQNVDEVRRSPAGTLIRLEGKIDALKIEIDQRFDAVDQQFDAINQRFTLIQWVVILIFSLLVAMAGKLFLS